MRRTSNTSSDFNLEDCQGSVAPLIPATEPKMIWSSMASTIPAQPPKEKNTGILIRVEYIKQKDTNTLIGNTGECLGKICTFLLVRMLDFDTNS